MLRLTGTTRSGGQSAGLTAYLQAFPVPGHGLRRVRESAGSSIVGCLRGGAADGGVRSRVNDEVAGPVRAGGAAEVMPGVR